MPTIGIINYELTLSAFRTHGCHGHPMVTVWCLGELLGISHGEEVLPLIVDPCQLKVHRLIV